MIAWQTWIVLVLSACSFMIAQVLDSGSGIVLAPLVAILLKTLAFALPLAANQLKAVGSDTPPSPPAPASSQSAVGGKP